jgi:hypothetical protein
MPKRKPYRRRNYGALELWTPKYKLRVVADRKKKSSRNACRRNPRR